MMDPFFRYLAEIEASPAGVLLRAAGFEVWPNGGNCTAFRRVQGALEILVTDCDSSAPMDPNLPCMLLIAPLDNPYPEDSVYIEFPNVPTLIASFATGT